jgi:hypothetical protein
MDLSGWLVMQYKVSPIDSVWSPIKGLPIQLWKAFANGFPKLLIGVPSLVPYCLIWGHDKVKLVDKEKFIGVGLSKYVEF